MHLREDKFKYSACGTFTKNKERIQRFKETGNSRYTCKKNHINLVFNMTCFMEILKIYLEDQLQIKYYGIKYLRWYYGEIMKSAI